MATIEIPRPVELIPGQQQSLWGWPAVVNFALGGLGAGLYVVAVAASGFRPSPAVVLASWLGPALVLAGFAAVASEAGRPFRGARVLSRVGTSWMSRELWIGGVFVLCAAVDLVYPSRPYRIVGVVTGLGLALAQGFIVRRARGVTAWDAPLIPLTFLLSALVSGAGGYLMFETASGRHAPVAVLGGTLVLLAGALLVWVRYLAGSGEAAFTRAVAPLSQGRSAVLIARGGYLVPFALVALAMGLRGIAAPAVLLAGALMLGAQLYAKTRLILAAGSLRPITLAVRIQRRSG
jgi:DMSO reductase anchor subunit